MYVDQFNKEGCGPEAGFVEEWNQDVVKELPKKSVRGDNLYRKKPKEDTIKRLATSDVKGEQQK